MRKRSLVFLAILMMLTTVVYANDKDNAQAHFKKGEIYYENEKYDEAIKEYRKSIEMNYNSVAAHGGLSRAYNKKGKIDEIALEYQRMIEKNPHDAIAHYGLGCSYSFKGKSFYNKAIEEQQEAIKLNPKMEYAHLNLGWVYGAQKKYDKAIEEFKKALTINSHFIKAHLNLGWAYQRKRMYQKAISEYKEIIEINPDSKWAAEAYYWIALCHKGTLELESAKKAYQKIIDDYPTYKIAKSAQKELINLNNPRYIRNLKKSKRFPNNIYYKILTYSPMLAFLSWQFGEAVTRIAILVVFVFIALIIKFKGKKDTISRYGYIKWGLGDVSKVFLLVLFSSILLATFLVKLLYFRNLTLFFTGSKGIKCFITSTLPFELSLLIFPLYYVAIRLKEKLLILGVTRVNLKRNISLGVRVAIIYSLMTVLWLKTRLSIGNELPEISNSLQFIRNESLTILYLMLLMGAIIGPLGEEVFCRGFLYPAFKKNIGVGWAILLSSLWFAAIHHDLYHFAGFVIMGIIFAYLYERTKSLVPSVITHASVNATFLINHYSNGQILKQLSGRSLYSIGAFAMLIFVVLGIMTKMRWIPKQYNFERSTKYCPNCKELFVNKQRECSNCGYKIQTSKKVNYTWEVIGTGIMLLFILLAISAK